MKSIRRILLVLGLLLFVLALSGCGRLEDYVSSSVAAASDAEIQSTEEYKQYKEYEAAGYLDENGLYFMPAAIESEDDTNTAQAVKVTIASNAFLNCIYYTDEQLKTPVAARNLFLKPGESLYVDSVTVTNDISNLYDFSHFRIWSYDQEGQRSKTPYQEISARSGLILKIPDSYGGTGFAIEPIGYYTSRHITARAFYLDNGQEYPLDIGQWKVDNVVFRESVDINPVDSYTITYDYSDYKDSYYFVDSSPSCWYSKESKDANTVTFREASSNDQGTAYAVELHSFVAMNVKNLCVSLTDRIPIFGDHGEGIIQSIRREKEDLGKNIIGKDDSFKIEKLKVGDRVSVRVGKEYKISGIDVDVGQAIPLGSSAENGYEYNFVVPETRKDITIEITERNSEAERLFEGFDYWPHADVSVKYTNGTLLKIGQELPGDNQKVTLTISPHEGYYIEGFTDKNTYSFVKKNIKYSQLEKEILSILEDHPDRHFISLNLVFADEMGSFTYKLDGKAVTNTSLVNVRVGQTLKVEYKANKGYSITHSWIGANAVSDAWTKIGGSDSISSSIKVTEELNGKTIDRETFGIIVEKEG